MLAAPLGSIGLTAKQEAANLYAAVAELSDLVDAGGEPVGVVGAIWTHSGFESAFHYPLERYKTDDEVESYLAEQDNILREEQKAIDAAEAA